MVSGESDVLAELVVPNLDAYERLPMDRRLTLSMIEDFTSGRRPGHRKSRAESAISLI